MLAVLQMIYCWLQDFWMTVSDTYLSVWDAFLGILDSALASISVEGLALGVIPNEYAWVLGATGMSQAVAIMATAMITRFLLQSVPFVRWGS